MVAVRGRTVGFWAQCGRVLALGGTIGLEQLSEGIRQQAAAREPSFLALLWLVVAAKVGAEVIALTLARPRRWPRPIRSVLLAAAWLAGAGLTLYGVAGMLVTAIVLLGVIEDGASGGTHLWYLVLWYPLWLLGGLAFLATAGRAYVIGRQRQT